jgi:hypothetical protein
VVTTVDRWVVDSTAVRWAAADFTVVEVAASAAVATGAAADTGNL